MLLSSGGCHLRDLSRGPHRRKGTRRHPVHADRPRHAHARCCSLWRAYADASILALAVLLLPAMLLGTALGRRITLRLSREQFLRVVALAVLCSGAFLIVRYAMALKPAHSGRLQPGRRDLGFRAQLGAPRGDRFGEELRVARHARETPRAPGMQPRQPEEVAAPLPA